MIDGGTQKMMNNDLISREALKKYKVRSEERHEYVVPVYNIDNAPTVSPNQGKWISHTDGYITFYTCNICNGFGDIDDKFCRHCGADMKGGKA